MYVWIIVWQFNVSWKVVRDIHWVLYVLHLLHRMNVDTLIMLLRVLPNYLSFVIFFPRLLHIFIYIVNFRRFSQNWEKRQVTSSCPSVCPSVRPSALNNSAPTGRIFERYGIRGFFENLSTNPSFIKIWQDYWYCTWLRMYIYHSVYIQSS